MAAIPTALGNLLGGIGFNIGNGSISTGGPGTMLGSMLGVGMNQAGGGGLGSLLNRRRRGIPSILLKRRKPKSLQELQMMQGGGEEESAP